MSLTLTATPGANNVTLTWGGGVPDALVYKIYRGDSLQDMSYLCTVSPSAGSYTDSTAVNGNTYFYAISVENSAGSESQWRYYASATPPDTQGSGGSLDDVGGGGSSDVTYTNMTPVPQPLGGIAAGTTFNNVPIGSIFDSLFYPYQAPAITSFSATGYVTTAEVGQSFTITQFNWTTSNTSRISGALTVSGPSGVIGTSLTGSLSGSWPYSRNTPGSATWTLSGTNTKGGTFSSSITTNWYWNIYYGEDYATLTSATDLRAHTLSSGFSGTYVFQAGNYKWLCWPTALGQANAFTDTATSLPVDMQNPLTVSVTNAHGVTVNYYCYRTTNIIPTPITVRVS